MLQLDRLWCRSRCRSIYKSKGTLWVGLNKGAEAAAETGAMWVTVFFPQNNSQLSWLCRSAGMESCTAPTRLSRSLYVLVNICWNITVSAFWGKQVEIYKAFCSALASHYPDVLHFLRLHVSLLSLSICASSSLIPPPQCRLPDSRLSEWDRFLLVYL